MARKDAEQVPVIDSWNPIERYKQHKALEEWVKNRPPSAGITAERLEQEYYPENKPLRRRMWAGAILGGLAAGSLARKLKLLRERPPIIVGLVGGGGLLGSTIAGGKEYRNIAREGKEARKRIKEALKYSGQEIDPEEIRKLPAPTATTYREVVEELKKQKVGFIPRHASAVITMPGIWTRTNAYFIPKGDKGLIVTAKKVPLAVIKHEAGHAKDYAYYGGEKGFRKAYPHYGDLMVERKKRIANTMLAEHRAWEYAKPRTKKDKQIMRDALETYKQAAGLYFSQRTARDELNSIIEFGVLSKTKEAIAKTREAIEKARAAANSKVAAIRADLAKRHAAGMERAKAKVWVHGAREVARNASEIIKGIARTEARSAGSYVRGFLTKETAAEPTRADFVEAIGRGIADRASKITSKDIAYTGAGIGLAGLGLGALRAGSGAREKAILEDRSRRRDDKFRRMVYRDALRFRKEGSGKIAMSARDELH